MDPQQNSLKLSKQIYKQSFLNYSGEKKDKKVEYFQTSLMEPVFISLIPTPGKETTKERKMQVNILDKDVKIPNNH